MGIRLRLGDIPVLDRVVMNVIKMTLQIPIIADDVIPEPALSETQRVRDPVFTLVVARKVMK